MVDTDDTRQTPDNARVWHKLPTGELKKENQREGDVEPELTKYTVTQPT